MKHHFEDKKLLVQSYLSRFTALQRLKGESATELRKLYHEVRSTASSLDSIGRPVTRGEDLFVFLTVELLDSRSRREWEQAINSSSEPPTYSELLKFLERRMHTLESLQPVKGEASSSIPSAPASRQTRALHSRKQEGNRGRCSLCRKDHYIMFCDDYRAKTAEDRRKHIEASNLCLNCLGKHKVSECTSRKSCATCGERHHTTLHDAFSSRTGATTSHTSRGTPEAPLAVLLDTARVRVADRFGMLHPACALIDQGSESSLVSESLVQRLRLPRSAASVSIFGVGGVRTGRSRGLVTVTIFPHWEGTPLSVSALVFHQLTIYESSTRVDQRSWSHLSGLELADPDYLASDPVELLLGADVHAQIIQEGLRRGKTQEPVAQKTTLGWIISGTVGATTAANHASTHMCRAEENLTALVRQFWHQEELPETALPLSHEDQQCDDFFRSTHRRSPEGRYIVRLPIREPLPDFSSTRTSALRVLQGMERRFHRDKEFQQLYSDFMSHYESLNHIAPVGYARSSRRPVSYLPHHGVLREASATTKLRVVFNGSTATPVGHTLNQYLMVGPNLLPRLADILLRWRRHRFVLAANVEKMYPQILVHEEDRDLQRIVWRHQEKDEVTDYRLNTVTYGLACAPFLAMRTLRQLADDEGERHPRGAETLRHDVYMDDVLTGAATLGEARQLQQELANICAAGGFPIRKWSANHLDLLADVPVEHRMQRESRDWLPADTHPTLGLRWHPLMDDFAFCVADVSVAIITRRSVLSLTARLFDPLGWIAPVTVSAKIALQSTWLQGIDWDTPLDEESARFWRTFQAELPLLRAIRVPRRIVIDLPDRDIELHGFADASERGFAAVVYLRQKAGNGWTVSLLAAKTKVAPLKQVSLPRLELCAATLLIRLAAYLRTTLGLQLISVHCWSDSTVVLGWIKGHPGKWKTYVANRVSEIQTTVHDAHWRHVPGTQNPADCASRGLIPGTLASHDLWWTGPSWLASNDDSWRAPAEPSTTTELPEARLTAHTIATAPTPEEPEELKRFSSLHRLLRVTAWCRRWLLQRKSRTSANSPSFTAGPLNADDLTEARLLWIRRAQAVNYRQELTSLAQGRSLSKRNQLTPLHPFVDPFGLLRVGGRLKNSFLSRDEQQPIILPGASHLTRLVVLACHLCSLHGGVQLTLGMVRQHYWIPRGRALVKLVIRQCVTCVRWRAAVPQQLMGYLPQERVTPSRPFLNTGVDYAGSVQLRTTRGRGHRAYKAFISVFVCLSTRAVHLEAVSDYTAEAFLAALRRFTSHRGLCRTLWSDCGTNFVGADAKLRQFFSASSPDQRRIGEGIRWRFNPPSAPHFGGVWEAAVKSLKHHLRRTIGDATLTFEEMTTLLTQVEACLNSRPLQALTDDAEDLSALTPGHFLIGSALTAVPEPSLSDSPPSHLSRWQMLQRMRDHFWARWSKEYFHTLHHRPKWQKEASFEVGRLCLVRDENTPPTRWPLARIVKTHPGDDGHVRIVTVRTASSQWKRPITKLVLLPVCDHNAAGNDD